MIHKNVIFILGVLSLLVCGCQSSKKALQSGDYLQACNLAINKLRSNPDHKTSIQSLSQAYPLLLETKQNDINNILTLGGDDKYRRIYNIYALLNGVCQNIRTCPGALNIIPAPKSFYDQQAEAQKQAFEECIRLADGKMQMSTRESSRQAYYLYAEALSYKENDPATIAKKSQALDNGTLRVLVDQIPAFGRYQLTADFFYDQVFTNINNNPKNIFTRFYQPAEARKIKLIPDQVMTMVFEDFTVGQVYDTSDTKEFRRDSVIVGTAETSDRKKVNVYGSVKAKMTIYTRTVESKGLLNVQIIDNNTKQLLANEKFPGVYVWQNRWGKYNGDDRALTRDQLRLCNRDAALPPDNQSLFIEFTKPIFTSVSKFLNSFYR
jgi:hypothetical protein